jgi:hypothetical protein
VTSAALRRAAEAAYVSKRSGNATQSPVIPWRDGERGRIVVEAEAEVGVTDGDAAHVPRSSP